MKNSVAKKIFFKSILSIFYSTVRFANFKKKGKIDFETTYQRKKGN